ncbi:BgTH12-03898 [Blumeria graminis f. sp. triticale]|uniref:Bgt-3738 n=3 Tax=Blumeria graminis TaxID=34373 RepID=A0A9X9L8W9_BLUGR|nr:BgTH12-03898 [Blumeria graminis f. sp. triticale]VCU39952.1 Bgt-3738 [Blumeria graminis f. sp. tritici]
MASSPPKRITRATAAAHSSGKSKTTCITTSTKVKKVVSTKRKTRNEEASEEQLKISNEPTDSNSLTTRGKTRKAVPSKTATSDLLSTKKPTRGRPRKVPIDNTPCEIKTEPVRSLRERSLKDKTMERSTAASESLPKRTRGRPTTVIKPPCSKKTVQFEEPDKENLHPVSKIKCMAKNSQFGTGLRARPVRKPSTLRTTRGRKLAEETLKSAALSPKKFSQTNSFKDHSDDELATTAKTRMKPLKTSPIKPPHNFGNHPIKIDLSVPSNACHSQTISSQDQKLSIMSPARRLPQTPFKDGMKVAALKLSSVRESPLKISLPHLRMESSEINQKTLLLQSPAKRLQSTTKVEENKHQPNHIINYKSAASDNNLQTSITKSNHPTCGRSPAKKTRNKRELNIQPLGSIIDEGHNTLNENVSHREASKPSSLPVQSTPILPFACEPKQTLETASSETVTLDVATQNENKQNTLREAMDSPVDNDRRDFNAIPLPSSPCGKNILPEFSQNQENAFNPDDHISTSTSLSSALLNNSRLCPVELPDKNRTDMEPASLVSPLNISDYRLHGQQKIGFTPLAKQLRDWMVPSPEKASGRESFISSWLDPHEVEAHSTKDDKAEEESLEQSSTFDKVMNICEEIALASTPSLRSLEMAGAEHEPFEVDQQDLDLAHEADEMSILEPDQTNGIEIEMQWPQYPSREGNCISSICLGEDLRTSMQVATFETTDSHLPPEEHFYPEENDVPEIHIDPQLLEPHAQQDLLRPLTPKRITSERIYHTVCKVPLKPAAGETSSKPSMKKKSSSVSRCSTSRPLALAATSGNGSHLGRKEIYQDKFYSEVTATPLQVVEWSKLGTPARTDSANLDPSLLKGAVVFVDVYTAEGADASIIFMDILTQMGARCVKAWNWSGNSEDGKFGITHVVFKDGGKRTLEKVRESNGVVNCVGVGWVLDCERENKWLDESPYLVDVEVIPRGGARRRKSMEPRALANLNGTLVPTSTPLYQRNLGRGNTKYSSEIEETPMNSKSRRRDSTQWIHNNMSTLEEENIPQTDSTPNSEIFSPFSDTPGGQTPYFLCKEQLVQKTAPAKRFESSEQEEYDDVNSFYGLKSAAQVNNQSFMTRLIAAKRKSLQWAPKIGSPLANAFEC